MYLPYLTCCFLIVQLGLQEFPWYSLNISLTDTFHFNKILVGVGRVRKFCTPVDIIKVNLMKFISKC